MATLHVAVNEHVGLGVSLDLFIRYILQMLTSLKNPMFVFPRVNNEPQSDKKEPKLRPQTPPSRQQRQQQQQQKHPPSPGRKFKAEFPSLEEQESMSKRELEELERRQRDEGRDGDRERSPERNSRPPGEPQLSFSSFSWCCGLLCSRVSYRGGGGAHCDFPLSPEF